MATPVTPGAASQVRDSLTTRKSWKALQTHYETMRGVHLRKLFADDPQRGTRMTAGAVGIFLDYSKNRVTDETLKLLLQLAEESGLRAHIDADPYAAFKLPADAKRIVTFLRAVPARRPPLPVVLDGARLLALDDRELFGAYVPTPRGPVFMTLIAKTFGDDVTTRTWDTIKKVVGDHGSTGRRATARRAKR